MRSELRVMRIRKKLTQKEFAEKVGMSFQNYSKIELGRVDGTFKFWNKLQEVFEIPDEEMYKLMKNE